MSHKCNPYIHLYFTVKRYFCYITDDNDDEHYRRAYVNLVCGLLREYNPNIIIIWRDRMSQSDWDHLKRTENDSDALEVMIKSCKRQFVWPDSEKYPAKTVCVKDVNEEARDVQQFWRRIELALPRWCKPLLPANPV